MTLHQAQLDGNTARATVRKRWQNATSSYIGATSAEVYDPASGTVLGQAEADEFVVELAWVAAARASQETNNLKNKENHA